MPPSAEGCPVRRMVCVVHTVWIAGKGGPVFESFASPAATRGYEVYVWEGFFPCDLGPL